MPVISPEKANKIYDILVEECDAEVAEAEKRNFVYSQIKLSDGCREWRFVGRLGFGGKFWNNNDRWYVSCYREDETPDRLAMIEKVNKRLADLGKE